MRSLAAAVAALSLAVPGAASAAKTCHTLTDPAGDHLLAPAAPGAYDIHWLDVVSDRNELVVVLGRGAAWPDPAVVGSKAVVGFTANGVDYEFAASRSAGTSGRGVDQGSVRVGGAELDAKAFTFRVVGSTIEWRVPRRALKTLSKPRQVFTGFVASTSGASRDRAPDAGQSTARYEDRSRSCVKAR